MPIIYLIIATLSSGAYSIFSDIFASKNNGGKNTAIVFNVFICISTFICWGIYSLINPGFDFNVIPYALGFGLSMFLAFLFNQLAFSKGNASIVTLIVSFSLILVAIYGFFFWNSDFSFLKIVGLIAILIALALILFKNNNDKKSSYLWLLFAVISMVANAACSVLQKEQQFAMQNKYGPQFMLIATCFSSLLSIVFMLFKKKDIQCPNLKKTFCFPLIAGLANFSLNVFVLLMANTNLSPTIIYPTISMSIILVILYSSLIKKEKLKLKQWLGIAAGVIGIVLLSL